MKADASIRRARAPRSLRSGFTLMEMILVMVLIVIISSISLPYFSGSLRGSKLRTSARLVTRMANYAHSMAIVREETLTMALNPDSMELFVGAPAPASTNAADGELDQEVLKRLEYVDGGDSADGTAGLEKEVHRFLPEGLMVKEFRKDLLPEDEQHGDLHLIHYYPNGQSEWFILELEDSRGNGLIFENDPVSGKVRSEFTQ